MAIVCALLMALIMIPIFITRRLVTRTIERRNALTEQRVNRA
jgi:uncharacterized protein YneF (UPF0154 family)